MLTMCVVFESLLEQASPSFMLIALRYKMCHIKKEHAVIGQNFLNFWRKIGGYLQHADGNSE